MAHQDINSAVMFETYNFLENEARNPEVANHYKQMVNQMRNEEETIVSQGSTCPLNELNRYLGSLDEEALKYKVSTDFDNPDVMRAASCIADSISEGLLYIDPDIPRSAEIENTVTTWYSQLKQIGAESVAGVALLSSLKDAGGFAVIKAPRNPEDRDFVHELVVGKALNVTRRGIPNFSYVYGGFKCPPPVINAETKEVVSLCGNRENKSVQYIIYEAINPNKSAHDSLPDMGPEEFLSMMMQVALATAYADGLVDWTHYDLHDENVLLRDISHTIKEKYRRDENEFFIRYPFESTDYYVRCNKVATIIDYGRAHVKINNKHYGFDLINGGIFPDRALPISDVFKFLMFCGFSMSQQVVQAQTVEVASLLYTYFNRSENFIDAARKQRDTFYVLPDVEYTRTLNIGGFIDHAFAVLPEMMSFVVGNDISGQRNSVGGIRAISGNIDIPVLGCNDLVCERSPHVYHDVGMDGAPSVSSVLEYYEQKRRLVSNVRPDGDGATFEQIQAGFAQIYRQKMAEHLNKINNNLIPKFQRELGIAEQTYTWLNPANLSQQSLDAIFTIGSLNDVRTALTNLSELRANIQKISLYLLAGIAAAEDFNDAQTLAQLQQLRGNFEATFDNVKLYLDAGKDAAVKLQQIASSPQGLEFIRGNREFNWYRTTAVVSI